VKENAPVDGFSRFLTEIGRTPLLTAAEEVELAKRVERGDRAARRRMIEANLRLVVSVARHYRSSALPLPDLVQEGVVGLARAVEKFDWRRGTRFSTYATFWIRQSIHRALDNQGSTIRIPAHIRDRRTSLLRTHARLTATTGREPSCEELADEVGASLAKVMQALDLPEVASSLDQPVSTSESATLADAIADPNAVDPVRGLADAELRVDVRRALDHLPPRARRAIELRYGLTDVPHTLSEVGQEFGVTRERARQIERDALNALMPELADYAPRTDPPRPWERRPAA
jgi:RNA polymerase primary sigma factor